GEPLMRSAAAHGAGAQQVVNAVWLPLLLAGAIPNVAYCVYLLSRQRSWENFRNQKTPAYLALAVVMAILWFFSTALYGVATTRLGELGVVVGWHAFSRNGGSDSVTRTETRQRDFRAPQHASACAGNRDSPKGSSSMKVLA